MGKSTKINKTAEISGDTSLIAGLQKHLPSTTILVAGTSYATADLVKLLQGRVDAINATIATRAIWQNAVKTENARLLASQGIVGALRRAIFVMFADVDTLADFGLTPHKKAVITPAERVVMVAKAKATRAARHTMGSKQKAALSGPAPAGPSPAPAGGASGSPATAGASGGTTAKS